MVTTDSTRVADAPRPAFTIPSLDGIRAVAFLIVFLAHAGVPGIPGGFGVTVFFFLSGYLITTLLRLELAETGGISFRLFYLRRVLRILPPFYLVLGLAVLLTLSGLLPGKLLLPTVAAQALHYSNYWGAFRGFDGIPAGTAVYWSLAVEEHFYAVFPVLYWLLARGGLTGRAQRACLLGLCLLTLLWRCLLVFYFHAAIDRTYLTTDTRFDALLVGCALAVAGNPMLDVPKSERPSPGFVALLCGAAALLLVTFAVRDDRFRESVRYSLQGIALYPLFYGAIRFPSFGPFRLLNRPELRFLGKLSYSLYLVHHVLLELIGAHVSLPPLLRGVLAFPVSLGVSWLIWISIEKPAARMRKRLESHQRGAPAATA